MGGVSKVLVTLNFSAEDISARSKIPIIRIREILQGASVSQSELRALSSGLRIPLTTFAAGKTAANRDNDIGLLFREAKIDKRRSYEGTIEAVSSFVRASLEVLPTRDGYPPWLDNFAVHEETYLEAEKLAQQFRGFFFADRALEPIVDLAEILVERASVVVSHLGKSSYEGVSVLAGGYAFIFVSPRFAGRMLFTVAHELGHILAHREDGKLAVFDRPTQIGNVKSRSKAEAFVDAFAANILMPANGVGMFLQKFRQLNDISGKELGDVEIIVLARYFGVSFEAAALRCEALGLLPAGGAYSLNDFLKKHHGSAEKRAEELALPPRQIPNIPKISHNLSDAIVQQISLGELSIGSASNQFGMSVDEIYRRHSRVRDSAIRH